MYFVPHSEANRFVCRQAFPLTENMSKSLRLEGFPPAYSKVKAELFLKKVASDHGIDLGEIRIRGTSVDLSFVDERDIDNYIDNLPKFFFGGKHYSLRTIIIIEHGRDDSFTSLPSSSTSLLSSSPYSRPLQSLPVIPSDGERYVEEEFHDCIQADEFEVLEEAEVDFSKTITWFDFDDFLEEQNKTALLVQAHDVDIGHERLIKYFESTSESNGGPIKKMLLMIDGVLILFHRPQTAEKVVAKKVHRIDGKQIKLFLKTVPEIYNDRLISKNNSADSLPEEDMLMEIANLSPNFVSPERIVSSDVKNVSVVRYKEPLDKNDFRILLERATEREFDESSKILPLPKSDCIMVKGFPGNVELRRLKIRLENRAFSNCAQITRIDRTKCGAVLVYFASFRHAEDVLKRHGGSGMDVVDAHLTFKEYFHCLSNAHQELEAQHTLDAYSKTMLDRELAPMSFDFSDVDEEVLKFVSTRRRHLQKLRGSLTDLANVEIAQRTARTAFKITPISVQVAKDQVDFKDRCVTILKTFVCQFASKRHDTFNYQNLEKVRQANVHQNLNTNGVDDPEKEYAVKWTGSKWEVLVVTGIASEVNSIVKSIIGFTDISNETLALSKGKYRWVIESGKLATLSKASSCRIGHDDDNHTLSFVGTKTTVANAHVEILKSVEPIKDEKFDSLDVDQANFLSNSKKERRITEHVNTALSTLKATLTVDKGIAHLWCHENNMNKAVIALRKMLITDKSMLLSPAQRNTIALSEWRQEQNRLQSKYLVEISIRDILVILVGFQDQIEPVKSRIKTFLDDYTVGTRIFKIGLGKAQFIINFCNEFKKCNELKSVDQYDIVRGPPSGISVKGTKASVEKVLGILNKQKVLDDKSTWSYFQIVEYFENGKGKSVIEDASSNHKCVILPEGSFPEEIADSPPDCPAPSSVDIRDLSSDEQEKEEEYFHPRFSFKREVRETSRNVSREKLTCVARKGDITMNQSDAIVNCIGNNFSLQNGGLVCLAILKKGGSDIQADLDKCKDHTVRVTRAGSLPSKFVIHANFTNSPKTIKKRLKEVLRVADEKKCQTIGIPAIGTGNMHLSVDDMARLMHDVFDEFGTTSRIQFLRKIEVVIFDDKVFPGFDKIFNSPEKVFHELHGSSPPPSSPVPVPHPTLRKSVVQPFSSSVSMGLFTITVKKGDITEEKNDVIVNSVGSNFDLSQGLVSQQIVTKGGSGIQKELSNITGSAMRVTSGGSLQCGKIIHVVFPNTEDKMKDCVSNIICKAEEEKCSSISIPALGTGKLSLPSGAIAKLMREAFSSFINQNPTPKYLKRIDIVVFDEPKLQDFVRELITSQQTNPVSADPFTSRAKPQLQTTGPEMTKINDPIPEKSYRRHVWDLFVRQRDANAVADQSSTGTQKASSNSIQMGSLTLTVRKGDITEEKSDAIVNSTGLNFDLSKGQVSRIIVQKGGIGIQKELDKAAGTNVRVTSGGTMPCGKIIHAVVPNNTASTKQCVKNILAKAEEEKCGSLSLPAIGTGNLRLPCKSVAKLIREAVADFAANATIKYLKAVDIVIFEDSKYSDFLLELVTSPKVKAAGAIPKKHQWASIDQNYYDATESIHGEARGPQPTTSSPPRSRFAWTEPSKKSRPAVFTKPKDPNTITLYFYCAKKQNIQKAVKAINGHVDLVFGKTTMSLSNLDDLMVWKSTAFHQILSRANVMHQIDKNAKTITLSGLKDDAKATEHKILQLASELSTVQEFQSIVPYSWKYCDSSKQWQEFGPFGNKAAEEAQVKQKQKCENIYLVIGGKTVRCVADLVNSTIRSMDPSNNFDYSIRRDVKEELPRNWDRMTEDESFKQVKLQDDSEEYRSVKQRLLETVPKCTIHSISRLQNKKIYFRYQQEKRRVAKISSAKQIERVLFHGTSADIGDKIANEGFDRGYAGAHAVAYGNGVYFAKNASYSNDPKYTTPNSQNVKTMLVAKVITGTFCRGAKGMKSPPAQPGTSELYNCAVNNTLDPSIFVVFLDAGAYPEYMIKYTG